MTLSGTVKAVLPKALTIQVAKSGKSSKSQSSASCSADQGGIAYIECSTKGKKKTPKSDSGVWTVYPKPNTQVLVEGTATLDYLRPAQTVEFTGNLAGDTITDTIDKINIVPRHGHNLNRC